MVIMILYRLGRSCQFLLRPDCIEVAGAVIGTQNVDFWIPNLKHLTFSLRRFVAEQTRGQKFRILELLLEFLVYHF